MKKKLKLKYLLNVYNYLEDFPTSEDILYEMTLDDSILQGKNVTLSYIKYLLSFKIENEKLEDLLEDLYKQKYIEFVQQTTKKTYKLLTYPWK